MRMPALASARVDGIRQRATAATHAARPAAATKPREHAAATPSRPSVPVRLPALDAIADRTATPRAAPTSWPVIRKPEATPAWLAGMPVIAVTETGANTLPTPRPRTTRPGRRPVA